MPPELQYNSYVWNVRENIPKMTENIDKTMKTLKKTEFEQAFENLQQSKIQFQNLSNERALKDIIKFLLPLSELSLYSHLLNCENISTKDTRFFISENT